MKDISSSRHSSVKSAATFQEQTLFYSPWYGFYSYVILVSMKMWTQHLAFHIFFSKCHIYNTWCRATTISTYVILSSSNTGNDIWLTCNKIITWVVFLTVWFVLMGTLSVKSCFIQHGSPRANRSLRFWQSLLATSMESSGKMLWRNG